MPAYAGQAPTEVVQATPPQGKPPRATPLQATPVPPGAAPPGPVHYSIGQQDAQVISNVGRDQYDAHVQQVIQQRDSFLRDIAATKTKARWLGLDRPAALPGGLCAVRRRGPELHQADNQRPSKPQHGPAEQSLWPQHRRRPGRPARRWLGGDRHDAARHRDLAAHRGHLAAQAGRAGTSAAPAAVAAIRPFGQGGMTFNFRRRLCRSGGRKHYLVTEFDTDDESRYVTEVCRPILQTTPSPRPGQYARCPVKGAGYRRVNGRRKPQCYGRR